MPDWLICRTCLAYNVPVYDIMHTRYQVVLERITSISVAEASKPHALCTPCLETLDKCCRLQEKSAVSEGILTRLLQQNQLTEDAVKSIDRQQLKLADYLPTFAQLMPTRASEGLAERSENIMVKIEPFDTQTLKNLVDFPEQAKSVVTIQPSNNKISIEPVQVKEPPYIKIDTGKLLTRVKTEVDSEIDETSNVPAAFDDGIVQLDIEMEQTEYNEILDSKNNVQEHIQKVCASKGGKFIEEPVKLEKKTEIGAYVKKCRVDNRRLKTLSCSKNCEFQCEHKPLTKPSQKPTLEESISCSECEYKTSSRKNLLYHMKRHTNKLVICATCGYKCATKSRLVSHIRIHTKERPYQCNVCGKNFTWVGSLSKHFNNLHKGVKAFKCMWCDYGAATKSHLDRHIQRHTGDKRFKCELCDYACVQGWDLKRHVKTHENDRSRCKRVAPVIVRIVSKAEPK